MLLLFVTISSSLIRLSHNKIRSVVYLNFKSSFTILSCSFMYIYSHFYSLFFLLSFVSILFTCIRWPFINFFSTYYLFFLRWPSLHQNEMKRNENDFQNGKMKTSFFLDVSFCMCVCVVICLVSSPYFYYYDDNSILKSA